MSSLTNQGYQKILDENGNEILDERGVPMVERIASARREHKYITEQNEKKGMAQPEPEAKPEAKPENPELSPNLRAAQAGLQAAQSSSGSGPASKVGAGLMTAGAVPTPASPYLIGAGALVGGVGAVMDAEQAKKDEAHRAKLARTQQQQLAMSQLMDLSNSFRS